MAKSKFLQELESKDPAMDMTPVIDISFLLIVFFICLPFKSLESKLAAYLPTDKGINPTNQAPPNDIKVSVHIQGRETVSTEWGPKEARQAVKMPSKVRFKVGDQSTDDVETVYAWIMEAKKLADSQKAADARVIGEIKASHKIPTKFIVAILNKFAQAGLEKVDFYGTAIPGPDLRRAQALPYPTTDYVGVEGG